MSEAERKLLVALARAVEDLMTDERGFVAPGYRGIVALRREVEQEIRAEEGAKHFGGDIVKGPEQ